MQNLKKNLKPFELIKYATGINIRILLFLLLFPRFTNLILYLTRPFYADREKFPFRNIRWSLMTLGAGKMQMPEFRIFRYKWKATYDNLNEVMRSVKKGKPIIWVQWIMTGEICYAFGAQPFMPEGLAVPGNGKGTDYPAMLIEAAEEQGTPTEYCSAQKNAIGAYLLRQIPDPDLILSASHPCDTGVSAYQSLEFLTGVPTYIMDVPYWKDENSYEYFEENTWGMIHFLENHLKRKIDWNKLREMLDRVNRFNFFLREICEMSRAIPCPASIYSVLFCYTIRINNLHVPYFDRIAEDMYLAVKKRFDRGQGIIKNEKIRVIMWFPTTLGYMPHFVKWIEDEYGAVVVVDFLGYISTNDIDTSSPETMIKDIAKSQMNLAMGRQCHGPVEFITAEMEKLIDEYSVDCMIFLAHQGCKHGWAAIKIVQDRCKAKKLPALYLNLDIMDKRHTPENEIKNQVTDFFRLHGWA